MLTINKLVSLLMIINLFLACQRDGKDDDQKTTEDSNNKKEKVVELSNTSKKISSSLFLKEKEGKSVSTPEVLSTPTVATTLTESSTSNTDTEDSVNVKTDDPTDVTKSPVQRGSEVATRSEQKAANVSSLAITVTDDAGKALDIAAVSAAITPGALRGAGGVTVVPTVSTTDNDDDITNSYNDELFDLTKIHLFSSEQNYVVVFEGQDPLRCYEFNTIQDLSSPTDLKPCEQKQAQITYRELKKEQYTNLFGAEVYRGQNIVIKLDIARRFDQNDLIFRPLIEQISKEPVDINTYPYLRFSLLEIDGISPSFGEMGLSAFIGWNYRRYEYDSPSGARPLVDWVNIEHPKAKYIFVYDNEETLGCFSYKNQGSLSLAGFLKEVHRIRYPDDPNDTDKILDGFEGLKEYEPEGLSPCADGVKFSLVFNQPKYKSIKAAQKFRQEYEVIKIDISKTFFTSDRFLTPFLLYAFLLAEDGILQNKMAKNVFLTLADIRVVPLLEIMGEINAELGEVATQIKQKQSLRNREIKSFKNVPGAKAYIVITNGARIDQCLLVDQIKTQMLPFTLTPCNYQFIELARTIIFDQNQVMFYYNLSSDTSIIRIDLENLRDSLKESDLYKSQALLPLLRAEFLSLKIEYETNDKIGYGSLKRAYLSSLIRVLGYLQDSTALPDLIHLAEQEIPELDEKGFFKTDIQGKALMEVFQMVNVGDTRALSVAREKFPQIDHRQLTLMGLSLLRAIYRIKGLEYPWANTTLMKKKIANTVNSGKDWVMGWFDSEGDKPNGSDQSEKKATTRKIPQRETLAGNTVLVVFKTEKIIACFTFQQKKDLQNPGALSECERTTNKDRPFGYYDARFLLDRVNKKGVQRYENREYGQETHTLWKIDVEEKFTTKDKWVVPLLIFVFEQKAAYLNRMLIARSLVEIGDQRALNALQNAINEDTQNSVIYGSLVSELEKRIAVGQR